MYSNIGLMSFRALSSFYCYTNLLILSACAAKVIAVIMCVCLSVYLSVTLILALSQLIHYACHIYIEHLRYIHVSVSIPKITWLFTYNPFTLRSPQEVRVGLECAIITFLCVGGQGTIGQMDSCLYMRVCTWNS